MTDDVGTQIDRTTRDLIDKFRSLYIEGKNDEAQKLAASFWEEMTDYNYKILFAFCEQKDHEMAEWYSSIQTFELDDLSDILNEHCHELNPCLKICELLADKGATVDAGILCYLHDPDTAAWLMQRFDLKRDVCKEMEDGNYGVIDVAMFIKHLGVASWFVNQFSESEVLAIPTRTISDYKSFEHFFEIMEQYISNFGIKIINDDEIDYLIRSSISRKRLDMTEKFVKMFQVDPRAYGINPDFADLGPKFAGKE
jgi:hypothetical protein